MTVVAACAAVSMNAQMYVGGGIGFQNNKTNNGTVGIPATTETTRTGFTFSPEFGMALDDKMGVGIVLDYTSVKNKVEYVGTAAGTPSVDATVTTIGLRPYLRYQLLQLGKVNVFLDGGVNLAFESQKDMKSAMDLGLFAQPGIAYSINDQWSIAAHIRNMFTIGYHKGAVPDVAGAPDAPTSFNAAVNTGGFNTGNIDFSVYFNF